VDMIVVVWTSVVFFFAASIFTVSLTMRNYRYSSSRDPRYPPMVPLRASSTSPVGSHNFEYDQPCLEITRTRHRTFTDVRSGVTITERDKVSVKGPPDVASYALELTEQAPLDSFPLASILQPRTSPREIPERHSHRLYRELPGAGR
jgi:hypothetical protein